MPSSQPNFVLFMTDQQRGDCLSADGHPVLLTPVMDSIGGAGTRFRRAYTTCPSCVPARRCLLSGQFPFKNRMVGMTTSDWDPPTTLPGELQKAGYQTAMIGRNMHQTRPDAFFMDRYLRQELPDPVIGDWAEPPPNNGIGLDIESPSVHLKGEMLRSCLAGYFGLINHVDDQIYRVMDTLKRQRRQFGDLVTMHCADHGEMLGDHYMFRKTFAYEGSARVPMLFSMPPSWDFPRGQVRNEPVCLEDIMPTVLDLADLPIPDNVDGRSLVPLLRADTDPKWRPWLHGEHARCYGDKYNNHYLTDGKEKYVWLSQSGRELLFDLENDPGEIHNLAAGNADADRVAVWRSRLVEQLEGRPEGFTDGKELIAGRTHVPVPPETV